MPVRVVLWSELFWPYLGGAEVFAAALVRSLQGRGFEFTVITSHDYLALPDEDSFHGIPVYRFPFRQALQPSHLDQAMRLRRRVAEMLADLAPDLVHLNGVGPSAFFCVEAVRGAGTLLLARLNQEIQLGRAGAAGGTLIERVLAAASWTVTVSATLLEQARRLAPAITPVSSVIYNGVDVPDRCPPRPRVDPPLLLCLGRLVQVKGFALAIDAFAQVLREWPEARLRIVGDGPERGSLNAQVAELGIESKVDFSGWVSPQGIPEAMRAATLVLVPSFAEGLPGVAIQAAAAGRAVLASPVGGLPEVVRDGETGLLVDLNGDTLASGINRLLGDSATLAAMGEAAWSFARERFAQGRCVDEYASLYRRLVA